MKPDTTLDATITRHNGSLFALLVLIGLCYVGSLGYFLTYDVNVIDAPRLLQAEQFVKSRELSLPTHITFDSKSPWIKALGVGWSNPEPWGIWSRLPRASILLPPVSRNSAKTICVRAEVGSFAQFKRWPMQIFIDHHPLDDRQNFSRSGPYFVTGTVTVPPGKPIEIHFNGPSPAIPRFIHHGSSDPRVLSFMLYGLHITQCGPAIASRSGSEK